MAPYKLGITGSIAMGKTQTATFFKEKGVPVWDADKTVHKLYQKDRMGYKAIKEISETLVNDNEVDRSEILNRIKKDKKLLGKIEMRIHPLLKDERHKFIKSNKQKPLLVFDIPLLFETHIEKWFDGVLVVKANDEEQERRVLNRGIMSRDQFLQLKSKQMPIKTKCRLATFIIDTDIGMSHAKKEVSKIIEFIKGQKNEQRSSI